MKLLNEQYFPVTLFTVQYISIYDSDQNPTVWLSQWGGSGFQETGMIYWGQKSKPQKFPGLPTPRPPPPPPPQKKKNLQIFKP